MLRLLNIELYKLKYNRASMALITIYFILLTLIALIAVIKFDIGPVKFHFAEMGIFNFPYIWHFNTFVTAFLKVFLLLVIVSMVANEYSNKTLKQNLIDGLSKKEFVLSKFYAIVVFAGMSTLFVFVVSLILGLVYSENTEASIIFSDLEFLLAFFVKLLGFFSMGLFFGVLIKRSAFAAAGVFVFFLIELFGYYIVSFFYGGAEYMADGIFQFMPFKSMWNLIDQPGSRLSGVKALAQKIGEDLTYDYAVHWYEIAIVLCWTAIFIFLSYKLLKKRDL